MFMLVLFLVSSFLVAEGADKSAKPQVAEAEVARVIDDWHLAASQSDEERYFSFMAVNAVFIGIEETERWTRDTLRVALRPDFQSRQMWAFKSSDRRISISANGDAAWFDELLDWRGQQFRGVGVLIKVGNSWMISQYMLSIPIPKKALPEVFEAVRVNRFAAQQEKETPKTDKPEKSTADK
jgi:ketosteroid isomerase-like protein